METVYSVYSIYYNSNTNTFEDDFNSDIDVYKLMSIKDIVKYKKIGDTYYTKPNELGIIYEIEFPVNDDKRYLNYDPNLNIIFDEYGYIVYNISHFISPVMLSIFKQKKQSMILNGENGEVIELIYDDTW